MTVQEREPEVQLTPQANIQTGTLGPFAWPRSTWLVGIGLLILYAPALWQTSHLWLKNREYYSHGLFIFPLCAFVLYLQRQQIRTAKREPSLWGLVPLGLGLTAYLGTFLLHGERYALWTLLPTLAGAILALHGPQCWKITRFAVLFIAFAAPFPKPVEKNLNLVLKSASATGSAVTMEILGYTILQEGSRISVPGYELDVADGCSGYKKTIALLAFSCLYGYMFAIRPGKRMLLVVVSIPIALLANILRVSGLIAVTAAGGISALHAAHDWAEKIALVIAFLLFVTVGKLIGCKTLRFLPPSASQ